MKIDQFEGQGNQRGEKYREKNGMKKKSERNGNTKIKRHQNIMISTNQSQKQPPEHTNPLTEKNRIIVG